MLAQSCHFFYMYMVLSLRPNSQPVVILVAEFHTYYDASSFLSHWRTVVVVPKTYGAKKDFYGSKGVLQKCFMFMREDTFYIQYDPILCFCFCLSPPFFELDYRRSPSLENWVACTMQLPQQCFK